MRIYPASHYTMGGLWVDYELMTTIPGLYCAGEANFSDHGANRLGASALMQGLADGYFVLPYTIGNYLAPMLNKPIPGTDHAGVRRRRVRRPRPLRRLPVARRHPLARPLPPRAGQDHLGLLRHGPQRDRPGEGALRDPRAVRGVQAGPAGHRRRRERQPDAGEGRPGRRLLRARHADVPRRPGAPGELRRPLPLRVPDRGGRGAARRRQLRPRRGVGVDRRPDATTSATRRTSSTRPSTSRRGATSERSPATQAGAAAPRLAPRRCIGDMHDRART